MESAASPPPRGAGLLTSPGPGGLLARRLLPVAVAVPVLLAGLRLMGQRWGYYDTEVGVVLFTAATIVVFAGMVVLTAAVLERTDAERRRAAAGMQRERNFLRALMDNVPDSIYFKDADSRFLRISRGLADRLGLADPAAAVGKSDADFFAPDHARAARADEEELLRTGRPVVGKEERETWADGRRRWVLTTRLPLHDRDGTIVGTLGLSRDITERKQAEEALRETEAQLRLLLESTGEGIFGVDTQGRCTFINPAGAELLGHEPAAVLGQDMHALMHHHRADGTEYPAAECPIVRTIHAGRGCRVEHDRFWRADGTSFPVEYSAAPIRTRGKEFKGAVVTFVDNTEREQMRSMLMQSEKLASIGLLSAGIAHEINNPLSYVGNNLVVLQRDLKGLLDILAAYEGARDRLATVDPATADRIRTLAEELDLDYVRDNLDRVLARTRDGVLRVTNIVQSLRNLARTDRPQLEVASLPDLVEMAVEMVRGRLKRRSIAFETDYAATKVRCVPTQLGQVFLNLLTNAMHAIESSPRADNGGRIRVASRPAAGGITVEVEDNGCGIDPQHVPHLFDPFFTTKPVGEGTGLGLAITHGIVVGHGGRVDVSSEVGEGTRFRLFLPAEPDRPAAAAPVV